jgi:hypothetical protein
MNRAIGKKQVLGTQEIQNLQEEKNDLRQSIKDAEGYGAGTGRQQDVAVIQRQIDRIDKVIEEGKPGRLSSMQKDALQKEALTLADRFLEGLPTKYEMDHPAKCPGAVRKHMKWLTRFEKTGMVDRYKTIQRLLNPGEELSIESLRKEK